MSLPTINLNDLANMTDEEVQQALEAMRQATASLREVAVTRGIPVALPVVRKLSPTSMLIAIRRLARLRFQMDRFTNEFQEQETTFSEAKTAYLASHGLSELPEDIQEEVTRTHDVAYQELVTAAAEKAAAPKAEKTPRDPDAPAPRRGRPRKTVAEVAPAE